MIQVIVNRTRYLFIRKCKNRAIFILRIGGSEARGHYTCSSHICDASYMEFSLYSRPRFKEHMLFVRASSTRGIETYRIEGVPVGWT